MNKNISLNIRISDYEIICFCDFFDEQIIKYEVYFIIQ